MEYTVYDFKGGVIRRDDVRCPGSREVKGMRRGGEFRISKIARLLPPEGLGHSIPM